MSTPLNFEFADDKQLTAVMKVVGVGGAGGNAVDRMIQSGLTGVEFISINTDAQSLDRTLAPRKLQIGRTLTKGLGAGANPTIGREAADQDVELITEALRGADLVFISAGMGGGTGTGAAPKVAEIARSLGALTIAIITKPFHFEGNKRMAVADQGVKLLREQVDTLVVIPNQRLLSIVDAGTSFMEAFKRADSVLTDATRGISDIISIPGLINVDFADVRTIMQGSGDAMMGIGVASGEDRGKKAALMAIHSPLLEDVKINGALSVLVNITGSPDMTLFEIDQAAWEVTNAAGANANVIFGAVVDSAAGDDIRVTVIATGFKSPSVDLPLLPDPSYDFKKQPRPDISIPTITRREQETARSADPFAVKTNGSINGNGNGNGNGHINGNGHSDILGDSGGHSIPINPNRIHLEVNLDDDPPVDFAVPTFMRRNGNHVKQ